MPLRHGWLLEEVLLHVRHLFLKRLKALCLVSRCIEIVVGLVESLLLCVSAYFHHPLLELVQVLQVDCLLDASVR